MDMGYGAMDMAMAMDMGCPRMGFVLVIASIWQSRGRGEGGVWCGAGGSGKEGRREGKERNDVGYLTDWLVAWLVARSVSTQPSFFIFKKMGEEIWRMDG